MACVEITDDDFDDMHHALGRPTLAELRAGEHYRNHYVTEIGSKTAQRFETSGLWTPTRVINSNRDAVYAVNSDGKSALADWLELQAQHQGGGRG